MAASDKIAWLGQKTGLTKPPRQPLPLAKNPICGIPSCPTSTPLAIYLRIRPLIASNDINDINTIEIEPASEPNSSVATTIRTYPPVDSNAAKVVRDSSSETRESLKGVKEFKFHQVFGPETSQQEVYGTVAAPLVDGLFPTSTSVKVVGESALLFAYGISNSGKTHTMMGDVKVKQPNQTWGIIPRVMQDILTRIEGTSLYDLNLSYLEIYNEQIFDLLPIEKKYRKSLHVGESLRIRESRDGSTFVRGLGKHRVRDVAHGLELAEIAKKKRHTSSNKLNEDSSRSHCICQLEVVARALTHSAMAVADSSDDAANIYGPGYSSDEGALQVAQYNKTATLWIVDLAGSERSKRTGHMLRSSQLEATSINTSLMKLMRCLSIMRKNQSASSSNNVIPFRESKLTHLFMNHLTGPSANRTSMIVNLNPSVGDFDETQHVLSYAAVAKSIQISQIDLLKRSAIGGEGEPTHDSNGRALKRKESGNEPISKFSPKKLRFKSYVIGHNPKKQKETLVNVRGVKTSKKSSSSVVSEGTTPKLPQTEKVRIMENPKPKEPTSYEKEMTDLKTSLSIARAEIEDLRTEHKNQLDALQAKHLVACNAHDFMYTSLLTHHDMIVLEHKAIVLKYKSEAKTVIKLLAESRSKLLKRNAGMPETNEERPEQAKLEMLESHEPIFQQVDVDDEVDGDEEEDGDDEDGSDEEDGNDEEEDGNDEEDNEVDDDDDEDEAKSEVEFACDSPVPLSSVVKEEPDNNNPANEFTEESSCNGDCVGGDSWLL